MPAQQPNGLSFDLYGYFIDLDERGSFLADVRDANGSTVFEVRGGDALPEDCSSLVEDGFMSHLRDVDGLTEYLRSLHVIPDQARVVHMKEFEEALEAALED